MSDPDQGFLRRWSQRKAEARRPAALPPAPTPADDAAGADTLAPAEDAAPALELPPIETLDATSDYAPFLQRGVTAEVQRQALQRAWSTDAAIAGFRGMADYDWDFNAPTYGSLWPVDDIAQLVRDVLGTPAAPAPAEPPGTEPQTETDPPALAQELAPASEPEAPLETVASSLRLSEPDAPDPAPAPTEPAPARPGPAPPPARRHGSARPA